MIATAKFTQYMISIDILLDSPVVDLNMLQEVLTTRLNFVPRKYMNLRTLSIILPFASESFSRKPFTNLPRQGRES